MKRHDFRDNLIAVTQERWDTFAQLHLCGDNNTYI